MPWRPAARLAAIARYGFMSAAESRSSTRVDFERARDGADGGGPIVLPQVAFTGAHVPGTVRLYEFTVGAIIAISSGTIRGTARRCSGASVRRCRRPHEKTFLPSACETRLW